MEWQALKDQGNVLFKQGAYRDAQELYTNALCCLAADSDPAARVSLLLNITFSLIKQELFWEACETATELVALDSANVKAIFRYATALVGARLNAEAIEVANYGIELARSAKDKLELTVVRQSALDALQSPGPNENSAPASAAAIQQSVRACIQRLTRGAPQPTTGALAPEQQASRAASGLGASTSSAAAAPPDPASDARARGTECYKSGEYSKAIEHYSLALEHEPQNVVVLGNRSAAALMLKKYDLVVADCSALLALDSTYVRAYSRLSKAHLGLSNLKDAVRFAQIASEMEPGSVQLAKDLEDVQGLALLTGAAEQALAQGKTTTAMAYVHRAMSAHPDLVLQPLLLVLGEAQLKLGNCQEALNTGRKLLLAPGSQPKAPLLDFHARTLIATGSVPRAVSVYEQLYREDPDNVAAAKALKRVRTMLNGKEAGNAAFKAGKYQEAYDQYTRSLEVDSSLRTAFTAQVYANRANVCIKLDRMRDAVADAELAIASDKTYGKAYLRKAQAETKLGEFEEAVRSYTKAQEVEPGLAGIREMLETAKVELKKSKRVDYYKLLEIDQNCGDADIKKAYRRAALKYHPDKVKEEDREQAEKDFKLIQEANAILTDSQKRARYDAGWAPDEIENGFREQDGMRGHGCHHFSQEDILFSMFAGGRGFRF